MSVQAARHVCGTYYETTLNPITQHHIDSFNDLLERRIPVFLKASNPVQLVLDAERAIRIFIGGRDGTKILYRPPVDELENAVTPNICRVENKTYLLDCLVDIDIEYQIDKDTVELVQFEKVVLGQIPLMLRSKYCHLSALTPAEAFEQGEDLHELGGYFIVDGSERILLSQERLGNNLYYAGKRAIQTSEEEDQVGGKTEGAGEKYEYYSGLRSVSEDGTRGPYSHYMVIPPDPRSLSFEELEKREIADYGSTRLRGGVVMTLPGFKIPVPVLSVFALLGVETDKELYDTLFCGVSDRSVYEDFFMQMVMGHQKNLDKGEGTTNLELLRIGTKSRSNEEVFYNLQVMLFPHIAAPPEETTADLYRRKAYTLGYMLRLGIDNALNLRAQTDRDHFQFKRFDVSGDLCFQEFRRIYKETANAMKLKMDTRVHFEERVYSGKGLATLVQRENVGSFWQSYNFVNGLSKSFKGKWGGKDGISQILSRVSLLGTVSQLRRSSLQMDPSVKALGARRLHGSSFGLTCPSDVPDGRNVGMIKHFSLLTHVSTQSDSAPVREILARSSETFRPISKIHPSTWNTRWTRVRLNGDHVGVLLNNAWNIYIALIDYRRSFPRALVSVAWNRTDNELVISTDAGRPCRPLYRPGVNPDAVLSKKSWGEMMSTIFDMTDADESESVRISMTPFSSTMPSEIHGLFLLSPLSAVIPFSDHNPATRTAFSCAQCRQGASWYHSNFNKRFDTITLILNSPQRPICETWVYSHVLGRGGCMPYGENVIVAIATYTGYNQEDSVILNGSAMRRGLFRTSYFHSYTASEELVDPAMGTYKEFANPIGKADVKLKADKDYSKLDENGIIRIGSEVNEDTVLVGMVSAGKIDSSVTPKRGQRGIVDGIQMFTLVTPTRSTSAENAPPPRVMRGVKVRITESREPILGDKMSSRHGQKGTCGLIMPECDMPFTAKGLRPDLILNPHAMPSRMTTGQMFESTSARIGLALGTLIDATPFCTRSQDEDYRQMMRKIGLEQNGSEMFYNGMTGEMMEMEIFVGPTYYLRSKLMVEDKINYRDTGTRTLLTHQPLGGRSVGGGMRIGEMERDGLIAHGVSAFIEESFMKRADEHEVLFQSSSGLLDSTQKDEEVEVLRVPYAMSLLVKEMESMHVQPILNVVKE
jgi:DNA-directed RNA polymerase II subunit RPB2